LEKTAVEKEEIVREIRRTAEENGGRPLGWRRFETETGISYSDWCGKHWVRWSDAVRDAGFGPNQFVSAYEDGELLEKLAELARELGHLPVDGEMRLKARGNSDFPSTKTFRRLGAKAAIVTRLREHCLTRGEYSDVVQMCDAYTPAERVASEEEDSPRATTGFVYLMKSGRFYKIGHSDAPGRRRYDLAIKLPEKVELIHKIPTEAPEAAERFWHERFKKKRKGGEWFALSAADVKAFRRCRSM
jgi:hypothetical protein